MVSKPTDSVDTIKIEALGNAIGVDANLPFATPYSDERRKNKSESSQIQEILQEYGDEAGPTVAQLVAMRRMDGQARALYRLITLPIRSALKNATFTPADGGEKEAEFLTQQFSLPPQSGGMSVTFPRFMAQLLQSLFDGFAAFEKVYDQPIKGPLKGKYVLKKLAHRPAETITFLSDEDGGFAGLRQRAYVAGKTVDVTIPKEYAFYYAAQEEERKFYGVSFFQSAFYHYDKKVKTYYVAHLAAQRAAVGTRVGTVPPNATEAAKRDFVAALSNLAFAQFMAFPEGFKVEILREAGSFDFLNYINHHNSQMSKSILAAFFDESQGSGSNDSSLLGSAQPGDDMFILMLEAIMEDIAAQINHYIIPDLIDLNFSGGKYPTFTWGKLTDDQKNVVSKTFDKLATAGQNINVTPEFVRKLEENMATEMGLDIDYSEVEKREKEEEEAALNSGVDPLTGQPIAAPVDPAAAVVAEEDVLLAQFEQQALALSAQDVALLDMASTLLDKARGNL